MITSINFPVDAHYRDIAGGWDALKKRVRALGCDGIEGIWTGEEIPEDFPADLMTGYHLTYFPEWLDFYRGDMEKVRAHFGTDEVLKTVFGGTDPSCLLKTYKKDLARALQTDPAYLVFHVSEISNEECFTYQWLHTDEAVIDASVEILNELLKDVEPTFDLLVENQWWPGFTFTDPAMTERLLSGIRYERTGILLDTGHLMNANRNLKNQKDGIRFVLDMLDLHGSLSQKIRGIHFHQSLSGAYVKKHTGVLPEGFPEDYMEKFGFTYAHILRIDRHRPWTDPDCIRLLERIRPSYLTHEMAGGGYNSVFGLARRQISTIRRGFRLAGKIPPL